MVRRKFPIAIIIAIFLPFLLRRISCSPIDPVDVCTEPKDPNSSPEIYRYRHGPNKNCSCSESGLCLRKCCARGYHASKGVCLRNAGSNQTFPDLRMQIYHGRIPIGSIGIEDGFTVGVMSCDFYALIPELNPDKEWMLLQKNGSLFTRTGYSQKDGFCVDFLKDFDGLGAFICYEDEIVNRGVVATGMIISLPFLLATFVAYALLPDTNLHMKATMSYVFNLMMSYLLLVIAQLSPNKMDVTVCTVLGFFILFFFMVSFFWMNVICIDIWFTFSGMRPVGFNQKSTERKRFIIYCGYAWGMSIVHVVIVYIIQQVMDSSSIYYPGIGAGQCFLKNDPNNWAELMYLYGPMALLITINVVLFSITAYKIRKIKKDTSVLKRGDSQKHSYDNDKQEFNLYVKLLLAMGINWSMEIISWAVDKSTNTKNAQLWYVTDFCNAIYGVFIFFIFVFKRNIWKLLKKRYYSFIGRPHMAHSMTQNPSTRVTNSTTVHDYRDSEGPMLTTTSEA